MSKTVIASLARIADFAQSPYALEQIEKAGWQTGDYVLAEVTGETTGLYHVEDTAGKMIEVEAGDQVVGALGDRAATLEGVGSWRDVRDGNMHNLTSAGLIGAFTSISTFLPGPMCLRYLGHVTREGRKVRMRDFALSCGHGQFSIPTVLLVGTSMSAGKTVTGRRVIEELASHGYTSIGVKLTGAGRYRDILSFKTAGAAKILDFVDAGLPSTIVPEDDFRQAIRPLLHYIDAQQPDFLVAEAGASPQEPYNGAAAIDELGEHIKCTILCASDPYAVVGVQKAFGLTPDIVSGPATTTSAGRDLVMKLTGIRAYNILDPESLPGFRQTLAKKLGVDLN